MLDHYYFRWICIYPAYLNNKKTLAQGRRLPKEICVENPTHQEIRDVLFSTGLRIGVENKLYPRERSKVNTKIKPHKSFEFKSSAIIKTCKFYIYNNC